MQNKKFREGLTDSKTQNLRSEAPKNSYAEYNPANSLTANILLQSSMEYVLMGKRVSYAPRRDYKMGSKVIIFVSVHHTRKNHPSQVGKIQFTEANHNTQFCILE